MKEGPRAAPDPSGLVRLFAIAVWSGFLVAVPLTLLLVFSGGPYGAMFTPLAFAVSQALGAFLMLVYGCWQVIVARLRPAVLGLALAAYLLPVLLVVGALRLSIALAGTDLDAYVLLLALGFPFLVLQLVGLRLARALRNRPPLVLAVSFVAPLLLGVAAYAAVLARDVTASIPWRHRGTAFHLESVQWEEGFLIMEGVLTHAEVDDVAEIWANYESRGGTGMHSDAESVEWLGGELQEAPRRLPQERPFLVPRGGDAHPLRIRWEYCDLNGLLSMGRGERWEIVLGLRAGRRGERGDAKRFAFPAPPPPDHACVSIWDWQPVVGAELMFSVRLMVTQESGTFRVEAFCGDRPAEMFDSAPPGAPPSERPLTEVPLEPREPRTVWLVWRGLPADSPGCAQAVVHAIRSRDGRTVKRIDIPLSSLSR